MRTFYARSVFDSVLVQQVFLTLLCSTSLAMCDLPCSVRCRTGSWVQLESPSEAERVQARATISRADAAPMGACPVRIAFVQLYGRARKDIMDPASTPSQRLIRVFRWRGIFKEPYMWAARRHHSDQRLAPRGVVERSCVARRPSVVRCGSVNGCVSRATSQRTIPNPTTRRPRADHANPRAHAEPR